MELHLNHLSWIYQHCVGVVSTCLRRASISSFTRFVEDCTRWRIFSGFAGWRTDPSQSILLLTFFQTSKVLNCLILLSRWAPVSPQIKVTVFFITTIFSGIVWTVDCGFSFLCHSSCFSFISVELVITVSWIILVPCNSLHSNVQRYRQKTSGAHSYCQLGCAFSMSLEHQFWICIIWSET